MRRTLFTEVGSEEGFYASWNCLLTRSRNSLPVQPLIERVQSSILQIEGGGVCLCCSLEQLEAWEGQLGVFKQLQVPQA